jgi:hypothetical protein
VAENRLRRGILDIADQAAKPRTPVDVAEGPGQTRGILPAATEQAEGAEQRAVEAELRPAGRLQLPTGRGPKGPGRIIRAEWPGAEWPGAEWPGAELSGPDYPGRKAGGRIIQAKGQEEFLVQPGHFSSTERASKHGEW